MNAIVEHVNTAGKIFVDYSWAMLIQSSLLILILVGLSSARPFEVTVHNVLVNYPDRPFSDHAEYLDILAQRLGLRLSARELASYQLKNEGQFMKVADLPLIYSSGIGELFFEGNPIAGFTPDNQDRIRQIAQKWIRSPYASYRDLGVYIGIMGQWPECIDAALQMLRPQCRDMVFRNGESPDDLEKIKQRKQLGFSENKDMPEELQLRRALFLNPGFDPANQDKAYAMLPQIMTPDFARMDGPGFLDLRRNMVAVLGRRKASEIDAGFLHQLAARGDLDPRNTGEIDHHALTIVQDWNAWYDVNISDVGLTRNAASMETTPGLRPTSLDSHVSFLS